MQNATLTKLDLSNNSITNNGAVAFAKALKYNNTLRSLNLRGNAGINITGGETDDCSVNFRSVVNVEFKIFIVVFMYA